MKYLGTRYTKTFNKSRYIFYMISGDIIYASCVFKKANDRFEVRRHQKRSLQPTVVNASNIKYIFCVVKYYGLCTLAKEESHSYFKNSSGCSF